MLKLSEEVFVSLQGEGPYAGIPTTFVRLAGCNLRCSWCDTKYSWGEGKEVPTLELIAKIKTEHLCVTGGEPLIQSKELGTIIPSLPCIASIETNGSLPRPSWWHYAIWDIDYKCPSAGVGEVFNNSWYKIGRRNRVKFVVGTEEDLQFVAATISSFKGPLCPTLIVSPAQIGPGEWSKEWLQRVWQFCIDNNLRFSLQLHKVVWGAERKGV